MEFMHPRINSRWVTKPYVFVMGSHALQRSWLFEKFSVTQRIKMDHSFRLELLSEEIEEIDEHEVNELGLATNQTMVRRVKLFADEKEFVVAKSIIPEQTKKLGFSELENLGNRPLGDLIFTSKQFIKTKVMFAKFLYKGKNFWGRSTIFNVNNYPMSINEVFLVD